ncbi:MAG: hypothetical protein K0R39_5202 [Symbiobacteriaceae bacterium]|jgi:hypothetical protein|nr:hypothetical protein [Symbiobacteriaceae bacterium]
MKRLVALILVALTLAAFAGTASARARGDIIFDHSQGHAIGKGLSK